MGRSSSWSLLGWIRYGPVFTTDLMNFLQTLHELLINFLWTSYILLTNFLQTSYKLLTNFLQTSYELLTNFLQTSYKLPANSLQTSYKLPTNFLQTSYQLPTNFDSNLLWTFDKPCINDLLMNLLRLLFSQGYPLQKWPWLK